MTKEQMIDIMVKAAGTNVSKAAMTRAHDALFTAIAENVKNDDKYSVRGFGTFSQAVSAEREGCNPQTQEKMTIAAKKRCKFTQSEAFKSMLND